MPSPPVQVTLPINAALAADTSMLTRNFGPEVTNYYAGSRLNRYSFLRTDAAFLRRAALGPTGRYIALCDLNAVTAPVGAGEHASQRLALFSYQDVRPLIGAEPAFAVDEKTAAERFDAAAGTPLVVFLGVLDAEGEGVGQGEGGEEESMQMETTAHGTVSGRPYFAVDITPRDPYEEAAKAFRTAFESRGQSIQTNPRAMTLHPDDAAIFAQARSLTDWNIRNRFCAGCGHPTLPIQAGHKRICPPPPSPPPDASPSRTDCPTRRSVSNVSFPRTDPTVIAAVLSSDGQRLLLGRQSAWPRRWHSTLAGFLEPGESVDEAVRREVWEESGVRVGRVVVHSTQPWPYPASLMIGVLAQALPGDAAEQVRLHDGELESARWFALDVVRAALARGGSPLDGGRGERAASGEAAAAEEGEEEEEELRVPPPQAIAHQLMKAVVEGKFMGMSKI